ncbi:MAG TPA: LLM class flavin-dependent oxidoreductase [Porticoccaceae bacterium]|nr:LLM class flavin-dependent oxidoreductase [Porticoccaceae bacterium]
MKVSYLAMTAYQGPAPGLEVWPMSPSICDPEVARRSMQDTLDLARHAEDLGFDWVSVAEHHYAAYIMSPNPVVMAAALSQVVKRARIALLGPLVPLSNPVRLAEEVAMLDNLSNGRVVVLFLRGTPHEHNTYDTPKEDTRGMTQEGIDLILKAWQEPEPFSWQGKHYQFSTVAVWPRMYQQPHPPMYGSGNSAESVIFAAKRRMGIAFSFAPLDQVREWVDLYHAEAAKEGWTPSQDQVLYRGLACVADSDQQAEEIFTAHMGAQAEEKARLQSKTMGGPPVVPLIMRPYFLGGPDTVFQGFAALRDAGVGVVDMNFPIGDVAQQKASLSIFGERVLPRVHRELALANA